MLSRTNMQTMTMDKGLDVFEVANIDYIINCNQWILKTGNNIIIHRQTAASVAVFCMHFVVLSVIEIDSLAREQFLVCQPIVKLPYIKLVFVCRYFINFDDINSKYCSFNSFLLFSVSLWYCVGSHVTGVVTELVLQTRLVMKSL
jgi:hypothetical protein